MELRQRVRRPLEILRSQLARSSLIARAAAITRNQLDGIVFLHLGHDIDPTKNGEAFVARRLAPTVRTFVDVGANVGNWTSMMLSNASSPMRGILFEPSKDAHAKLTRRFGTEPNLQIMHEAVADEPGELRFHEEPDAGTTSSLVAGFSKATSHATLVKVTTIDEVLPRVGLESVDFLKIDVEGYDLHVLRGARRALEEQKIKFLQFEYNAPWRTVGSKLIDAFALLERCGYNVYLLRADGFYRLPYSVYGDYYHYSNYVAFPASRNVEMRGLIRGDA